MKTKIIIIIALLLISFISVQAQQCNDNGVCEASEDSVNCRDCVSLNAVQDVNFAPTELKPVNTEVPQRSEAILIVAGVILLLLIITLIFAVIHHKKKQQGFAEQRFKEYGHQ